MGKTIFSSCCYFMCPSRSSMVNLIFHDGSKRVVTGKRLAGEIMFEFPDCMVCHADSFYIGNPIPSLNIDDKLKNGDTYFILPLDYFLSCNVLSASTLATLGSNPRRTPVNFKNPIFQYVKAENGRVLIKVSQEFIIKLLTRGNEDQENIITSPSDGKFLCNTPELKKQYEQLVGTKGQIWSPKLETISEYKIRYSPCRFIGFEWKQKLEE
ncbi:hypothetical protein AABB24_010132 [Solanum stoloniferum]|uniref:Uncharacterized protein n=2 Tax=Solanum TaxID=4107 RepID=A0AAF0R061_SOLVR|nr:uncharacterized protein LOC125819455 [Solanum verrucosum]WMV31652.1 hypothetical protein MTR67_025037 [Solanum verrucosum]